MNAQERLHLLKQPRVILSLLYVNLHKFKDLKHKPYLGKETCLRTALAFIEVEK